MTTAQIYDGLNEIFRDIFGDDDLTLRPDTTAADIAEWDSFNHINIIVAVEQRFRIKFNTVEVEALKNIGDMVALIERKQPAGQAARA